MAKANKAEKFIKRIYEEGKTRNGVRSAIFDKLGTWNFPPEYEDALVKCDPNYNVEDAPILGVDHLDDYICDKCGNCHETCFCGDELLLEEIDNEIDSIEEALDGLGHSAEAERAVFDDSATNHDFKCPGKETIKCDICPQNTFCTIVNGETECLFCRETPCNCATIELPKLPDPGTQNWEDMIDFMKVDMANNMGYTKLIEGARKSIEARGLNFNEEFEKWKEKKACIRCMDCGAKYYRKPNSTGYCESCGSANVKEY